MTVIVVPDLVEPCAELAARCRVARTLHEARLQLAGAPRRYNPAP
jgi:hypothetical protein